MPVSTAQVLPCPSGVNNVLCDKSLSIIFFIAQPPFSPGRHFDRKEVSLMAALRNAKHEKFVQCLIQGMSQRKAYREAFKSAQKWKDETVDSKASVLFQNGKVLERYQEIQKEQKEAALLTRWEKRKLLADIARDERMENTDRIRAIDTDNRMEGEYTTNMNVNVEHSQKLDDIMSQLGGGGLEE